MAKEFAEAFYRSRAWRRCRSGYIAHRMATDGGMCEVCHERPGYIVHHKIILTPQNIGDPKVSLNWDRMSYECKECHDQHEGHGVGRVAPAVCAFDGSGDVVEILPPFRENRI